MHEPQQDTRPVYVPKLQKTEMRFWLEAEIVGEFKRKKKKNLER